MNKFYPVAGMVALSAVTTACQQADKQEKKKRAKRRNAVPIGARGSLRRGAINERNEGAKR